MPRFHLPDLPKFALPKLTGAAVLTTLVIATAVPATAAGPIRRLLRRNTDRSPRQYDVAPPVADQPPVIILEDQTPDAPNYAPRTPTPARRAQGTREFSDSDTGYHRFGRSVVQRRGADSWDDRANYGPPPPDRDPDRSFSRRSATRTRDDFDRDAPVRSDVRAMTRSSAAQAGYFEEDRGVDRATTQPSTFRDDDRAVRDRSFDDRDELLPPPRPSPRAASDQEGEFDRVDRDTAADRDAAEPRFRDRPVRSRDAGVDEPADSLTEREQEAGPDLLPPAPPED